MYLFHPVVGVISGMSRGGQDFRILERKILIDWRVSFEADLSDLGWTGKAIRLLHEEGRCGTYRDRRNN